MNYPHGYDPRQHPQAAPIQKPTSAKYARWSLQLGGLSLVFACLTGIPAIIVGVLALKSPVGGSRKEAVAGIGLGTLTTLGTALLVAFAALTPNVPSKPGTSATTPRSAPASPSAVARGDVWRIGETRKVSYCSFRLVQASRHHDPERGWKAAVAFQVSSSEEVKAHCGWDVQLETRGGKKINDNNNTVSNMQPGQEYCSNAMVGDSLLIDDVVVKVTISPVGTSNKGFLREMAESAALGRTITIDAPVVPEISDMKLDCE